MRAEIKTRVEMTKALGEKCKKNTTQEVSKGLKRMEVWCFSHRKEVMGVKKKKEMHIASPLTPPLFLPYPSCSDKCLFVFWTENCGLQCTCQKTADFPLKQSRVYS